MKKSTLILFILSLVSCQLDDKLTPGVLSEEKMVELMVEMEIAQATLKFDAASEGLKPNYTEAFNKVFEVYSLDNNTFYISLDYYCSEPIKIRKIYDKVIVKLSENQGKLNEDFLRKVSKK